MPKVFEEIRRQGGWVPARVLAVLLAVQPHRVGGENCRPVIVGVAWNRLIAAGAMR